MLLEMVIGKEAALAGELVDATPYGAASHDIVSKLGGALTKYGYADYGWETLYNGETGEPLRARIFMGTSCYQKLKHLVSEKMHARSYGNITVLTRQPLAGRSNEGGLRMGYMEIDCLFAHGSVSFLRERLYDVSDPFTICICKQCGIMVNNPRACHLCGDNETEWIQIPYASKLLFQYLKACQMDIRFVSDQKRQVI